MRKSPHEMEPQACEGSFLPKIMEGSRRRLALLMTLSATAFACAPHEVAGPPSVVSNTQKLRPCTDERPYQKDDPCALRHMPAYGNRLVEADEARASHNL